MESLLMFIVFILHVPDFIYYLFLFLGMRWYKGEIFQYDLYIFNISTRLF